MEVVIVILVVIAALLAVISGVWVALALVTAISANRAMPGLRSAQSNSTQSQADDESSEPDI